MLEYSEYKDLHQHSGTNNYDIITIYNENSVLKEKLIDKRQKLITVNGTNKKKQESDQKKFDFFCSIVETDLYSQINKDGTLYGYDSYSNWLVNNDKTDYKYIDPFTNNEIKDPYKFECSEKDYDKWFETFYTFYKKSTYVKINGSSYYLKYNGKWFYMELSFDNKPKDFVKQYPPKINPEEIRMQPLKENMEALVKAGTIKIVDYIEQDSESGVGLNPINFSSGYYMLELHLPQGDTLKFRRYGAMGVSSEMFVYQIPKDLGGSEEVFFIEQEPNEMYPNKSFAGFYAIRPKNYKELPEYQFYLQKEKQDSLKRRRSFIEE